MIFATGARLASLSEVCMCISDEWLARGRRVFMGGEDQQSKRLLMWCMELLDRSASHNDQKSRLIKTRLIKRGDSVGGAAIGLAKPTLKWWRAGVIVLHIFPSYPAVNQVLKRG